ncbi:unnamed protein product [Tilletia caries]|nr:unnamed protein product [Tilletia caries]
MESWRGLAIDRAVLEHAAAVQESEKRDGIDGDAEPSSIPTALLRAIEALKASVYELGFDHARSYLTTSPSLVLAFVERLEAGRSTTLLKAIAEGQTQAMSLDDEAIGKVIMVALGPLASQR